MHSPRKQKMQIWSRERIWTKMFTLYVSMLIFELLSSRSIFYMKSTSKDPVHFFLSFFYSHIQTVEKLQDRRTWSPCFRQPQYFKLLHLPQWHSVVVGGGMQQVPISEVGKKEQERPIWFVPPKSLIDFFHLSRFPELCEFFLENETCSVHTSPAIKKKKKGLYQWQALYLLLFPGNL